jgi:hypothetical protein
MVPGGQGAEPPPYSQGDIETRMAEIARRQPASGPAENDTPTLGRGNPSIGADPANLAPAVDPTSAAGRRREGVYEAGGEVSLGDAPRIEQGRLGNDSLEERAVNLAYTASQKPNLSPRGGSDVEAPEGVQGSGMLQEPVERRDNQLVFDRNAGNFELKEELHEKGVSSQEQS